MINEREKRQKVKKSKKMRNSEAMSMKPKNRHKKSWGKQNINNSCIKQKNNLTKNKRKEMNILNLQVHIKKIKIKTNQNSSLCFSLRVGKILSNISNPYPNKSGIIMELNIDLLIGFQDQSINANSRACLIIYQVLNEQQKDIIGMVFILLKNPQNQLSKYKIQQCNDPASFIQLSFIITNLQVYQKQNQSLAQKSSLAQIKQFHHVLTSTHKKSKSDYSLFNQSNKKIPSSQESQLPSKCNHQHIHKFQHIKSQQIQSLNHEQFQNNFQTKLKTIEKQLIRQKQKNSILTNILVIQQTKNIQSQIFIKNTLHHLTFIQSNQLNHQHHYKQISNKYINESTELKIQEDRINLIHYRQRESSYKQKLQGLIKQRDYLFTISQQLYQRIKNYKQQNQTLAQSLKNLQIQLKSAVKQLQSLKSQNIELKIKIFQHDDIKNNLSNIQSLCKIKSLIQQNTSLKKQNIELQRKFKQTFRAIQQFKNDAWKAQEQLILKDQQIAAIKQDLENAKISHEHLNSQSNDFSSILYFKDQKQSTTMLIQSFKLMSALIMKNNLDRDSFLQKLHSTKKLAPPISNINTTSLIQTIKIQIDKMYREYEDSNQKMVHLLDLRKKIMKILNSFNF